MEDGIIAFDGNGKSLSSGCSSWWPTLFTSAVMTPERIGRNMPAALASLVIVRGGLKVSVTGLQAAGYDTG